MRNFINYCLLLLIFGGLVSCNKVDNTFGSEYLSNDITQIIRVDSFRPSLQTIYTDSFPTQAKGVSMIGGYTDPILGKVKAQTFLEVAAPGYSDIYANTLYDSITLILKVKRSAFYGDSTKPLHIDVNRLLENITPPNSGFNIYNVDTFQYSPTTLGSTDIVVRPYSTDTIAIKLNDALGKELFGMLQRGSDTIKTASVFLDYFKGLRLGSNNTTSLVLNCTDSVKMRINYRKNSVYTISQKVDFILGNNSHHFINVQADRTGTPLAGLGTSFKTINSNLTNNAAYTQPATGITAKITFPSVKDIQKAPNYVKLLKAILYIKPVKKTYETTFPLPPSLRLSTTTILNYLGNDLYAYGASGTPVIQYGNLMIDYINGENTTYSYDISIYIKQFLADPTVNSETGILVAPPSPAYETVLNRLVMGNTNNLNGAISLQLYYATIQP